VMLVAKYRIADIRFERDQVGIVLEGTVEMGSREEIDGFAVWIPVTEFEKYLDEQGNIDREKIRTFLKQKVKERIEFLRRIRQEREAMESPHRGKVDKLKDILKDEEIEGTEGSSTSEM